MKVMVVEEGEAALFFVCQALEALGAVIYRSPSLDEDKVLMCKIDAVLHIWSEFLAEVEATQLRNLKEAEPRLVEVIFCKAADVAHLRRQFKTELVADMKALEAPYAAHTAQAIIQHVRNRHAEPAAVPA